MALVERVVLQACGLSIHQHKVLKKEGVCLAALESSELREALLAAEVVAAFWLMGGNVVLVVDIDVVLVVDVTARL